MIAELRTLAGDALIAAGEKLHGGLANVDVAGCIGDGCPRGANGCFLCSEVPPPFVRYTTAPAIAPAEVRAAIDELPDSKLLNIAAQIIAGWKPILLSAEAGALTDVDVLVDALRDRAARFAAAEVDAVIAPLVSAKPSE